MAYKGLPEQEIHETTFRLVRTARGYDFQVIAQEAKKGGGEGGWRQEKERLEERLRQTMQEADRLRQRLKRFEEGGGGGPTKREE